MIYLPSIKNDLYKGIADLVAFAGVY